MYKIARMRQFYPLAVFLLGVLFLQAAPITAALQGNAAARWALRSTAALDSARTPAFAPAWWLGAFQPLACDAAQFPSPSANGAAPRLWGVADLLCGRFLSAQARLAAAIQARPQDRAALALLRAAEQRGVAAAPEQAWRGVIGWRLALGKALEEYEQGEVDQAAAWLAVADVELAAPVAAEYSQLYFWSCEILRAAGRTRAALAACEKLVAGDPANAEAWNQLGASLHQAKRYEEALQALAQVIALDPQWTLPRIHTGRSLRALGRLEAAVTEFSQVLQIEPHNVWARVELGTMALDANDCAAAAVHIKAIASQPISSTALARRADTFSKRYREMCD